MNIFSSDENLDNLDNLDVTGKCICFIILRWRFDP